MNHQIKQLSEAITNTSISKLVMGHVKELSFNEEAAHLVIYLDNAASLHELESDEGDKRLKKGLEQVYGTEITYELKLKKHGQHEREKSIPHNIKF